jgi:hypothetical protein
VWDSRHQTRTRFSCRQHDKNGEGGDRLRSFIIFPALPASHEPNNSFSSAGSGSKSASHSNSTCRELSPSLPIMRVTFVTRFVRLVRGATTHQTTFLSSGYPTMFQKYSFPFAVKKWGVGRRSNPPPSTRKALFAHARSNQCRCKAAVILSSINSPIRVPEGYFGRFGSHPCRLVSISYDLIWFCHGRGREFESRRPRHSFSVVFPTRTARHQVPVYD